MFSCPVSVSCFFLQHLCPVFVATGAELAGALCEQHICLLRPVQIALRLCLAQQNAWVRQADVLLTKHQQAKSLWPHTEGAYGHSQLFNHA